MSAEASADGSSDSPKKMMKKQKTTRALVPEEPAAPAPGERKNSDAAMAGGMRAIMLAKKMSKANKGKGKGKKGRAPTKLYAIPKMKDAEAWIEVWNKERKELDLFAQQFRGHPVKAATHHAEMFGSVLWETRGDQWASNGYVKPKRYEFLGSGGWPIEWGGLKAKAELAKITTKGDKMIAEEYNLKELICERKIQRIAAEREQDVRDLFAKFDTDGSGELDHEEFQGVLERLGFDLNEPDRIWLLGCLDSDGDGTVNLEEFMTFARRPVRHGFSRSVEFHADYPKNLEQELRDLYDPKKLAPRFHPLYSMKALLRRDILKFKPGVRKYIDILWKVIDMDKSGRIEVDEYLQMHENICLMMGVKFAPPASAANPAPAPNPEDGRKTIGGKGASLGEEAPPPQWTPPPGMKLPSTRLGNNVEALRVALEDWNIDHAGYGFLDYSRFTSCWFQLADQFTDGINEKEYTKFLANMVDKMVTTDEHGRMMFKTTDMIIDDLNKAKKKKDDKEAKKKREKAMKDEVAEDQQKAIRKAAVLKIQEVARAWLERRRLARQVALSDSEEEEEAVVKKKRRRRKKKEEKRKSLDDEDDSVVEDEGYPERLAEAERRAREKAATKIQIAFKAWQHERYIATLRDKAAATIGRAMRRHLEKLHAGGPRYRYTKRFKKVYRPHFDGGYWSESSDDTDLSEEDELDEEALRASRRRGMRDRRHGLVVDVRNVDKPPDIDSIRASTAARSQRSLNSRDFSAQSFGRGLLTAGLSSRNTGDLDASGGGQRRPKTTGTLPTMGRKQPLANGGTASDLPPVGARARPGRPGTSGQWAASRTKGPTGQRVPGKGLAGRVGEAVSRQQPQAAAELLRSIPDDPPPGRPVVLPGLASSARPRTTAATMGRSGFKTHVPQHKRTGTAAAALKAQKTAARGDPSSPLFQLPQRMDLEDSLPWQDKTSIQWDFVSC